MSANDEEGPPRERGEWHRSARALKRKREQTARVAKTAEARGLTQKVRLSNHLAEVIRQQMTKPEGYKNASHGFFQLVNRI